SKTLLDRSHCFVDSFAHGGCDRHEQARTEAIKSVTGTSKYNIGKQCDYEVAPEETQHQSGARRRFLSGCDLLNDSIHCMLQPGKIQVRRRASSKKTEPEFPVESPPQQKKESQREHHDRAGDASIRSRVELLHCWVDRHLDDLFVRDVRCILVH